MKKKIIYIVLLIIVIVGIIVFFTFLNNNKDNSLNTTNTIGSKNENAVIEQNESEDKKETIISELPDGKLYSFSNETINADIVIGDNYFDTQINDMYLNPKNYEGKTIEIEGMFLDGQPYTFVGRFSTSNICPYCPTGYSYIEYQWDGDELELTDQETWLKIIGKLEKGNDATSYYQDFYYIKAFSVEIMNEKGQDTVNN